jgi:hypothetical protein
MHNYESRVENQTKPENILHLGHICTKASCCLNKSNM